MGIGGDIGLSYFSVSEIIARMTSGQPLFEIRKLSML